MSERRAFGDRVRRQRERKGVTLEAIAQATKVPASLFAGLERGDCSRWPAGIYSRGYLRAYAEAIGLDPNEAVEDFTAAFGSSLPDATDQPAARRVRAVGALRLGMDDDPDVRQRRVMRRSALTVFDLLLAFGVAWLAHVAFETGVWTTLAIGLTYQSATRLLSDDSVVARFFGRTPAPVPEEPEDVSVTDPARTTA